MNSALVGFLDCIQVQKEPDPGQYLGEDGLIYCEKCRTPVQCRVRFEDKVRIMPCMCRCRQEENEKEKKADRRTGADVKRQAIEVCGSAGAVSQRLDFCVG